METYTELTVIGAHFGGWSVWDEAAKELPGYNNFYVDCSSSFYALSPEKSLELIRLYGADRVLFGTDYPMWVPKDELRFFNSLGLTEKEKELILYRNAQKLFGLSI